MKKTVHEGAGSRKSKAGQKAEPVELEAAPDLTSGLAAFASALEAEELGVVPEPMKPGECREHLRKSVAKEFRAIVEGFVEAAKKGSCQHLKLATELLKSKKKRRSRGKGSAASLLEELKRLDADG